MRVRHVVAPLMIGIALAAPVIKPAKAGRLVSHGHDRVSPVAARHEAHRVASRVLHNERFSGERRLASAHHPEAPVIQCVTFARADSGVQLSGNAGDWWDNAAGVYARGAVPQQGAVLSFRATDRMRLGHVAVVSRVINSRTIDIDQAHWEARGISRNVPVIDVSENNDWSAVRVGLGREGDYGSIYPTHGFIYARSPGSSPATSLTVASNDTGRALPAEQVAEVPRTMRGIDLATPGLALDAPDRALR